MGTVSWLNYQKKKVKRQIKHEIIAGIDKSELVSFTFSFSETQTKLKWKHAKEFEYNKSMYDIVEADTTNNTVTYWCWWDSKETQLNKKLSKLLAHFLGNNQQNKDTKSQFAQFYQSLYHTKLNSWKSENKIQINKPNTAYYREYKVLYFAPKTPPPNYC
ncbi:MAG: hypothetical protein ACPGSO_00315 [Vicingaceae bacterium]